MKHLWNMDYIYEGKTYKCINGVVDLPVEIQRLNPIKEKIKNESKENKPDWKTLAIDAGLEGDELKKFMKMNATNKQIKLDKLGA